MGILFVVFSLYVWPTPYTLVLFATVGSVCGCAGNLALGSLFFYYANVLYTGRSTFRGIASMAIAGDGFAVGFDFFF